VPGRSGRRRRVRRRTILLVAGGVFAVVVIVGIAGARDLLAARSRLTTARATLSQVIDNSSVLSTSAGRAATTQQLANAIDDVTSARQTIVSSLPLDLARFLPVASTQRSGLLRLVDDSATALATGDNLITQADQVVAHGQVNGARVPLASLATFEADVRAAGTTIAGLDRSGRGLVGPLHRARSQFDTLAGSTGTRLRNDADALEVGQALLGAGGVRRYFVALENNAEMRDQGTILSYAVITVDQGHIQVTAQGPILTPIQVPGQGVSDALTLKSPAPVAIPAGTSSVFGFIAPTQTWQSVNATADFDFSARAMQAMYHEATGQSVDGVIGLDVPALASLLSVVGPVTVPGTGEQITALDAGTVLLHDLYSSYPVNQEIVRKEALSQVVTDVVTKLSSGSFDPLPLAQQLATAAAGGHMKVWSDVSLEEATLERIGLGGGPATTMADRTFHVAVENRDATKLDYYVHTAVQQQVMITRIGTAIITTTIVVHDDAPVGAAPSYQLGPDTFGTTEPGEYYAWVLLWGPAGANQPESVPESGLQLTQTVIPHIFAGQSAEVSFVTVIDNAVRDGKLQLRYVPQPRLTPPALSVALSAPGWKVAGPATVAESWAKTVTVTWGLHR
jgi:Protein of unknown function (DUF4012)